MSSIAYGLRADYADNYLGGVIRAGDRDVNVLEALDDGSGVIVADDTDTELVNALDGRPELKRVAAPDEQQPVTSRYAEYSVADLRYEAQRRGLTVPAGTRKAALIDALVDHDQRLAAGDTTVEASPANPVDVTPEGTVAPQED